MDNDFVELTERHLALAAPNFIVEHQGRLYVTVAALEYDPNAKGLTREQKRGVKMVQKLFKSAEGGHAPAVVLIERWRYVAQSSVPKLPGPPPPPFQSIKRVPRTGD